MIVYTNRAHYLYILQLKMPRHLNYFFQSTNSICGLFGSFPYVISSFEQNCNIFSCRKMLNKSTWLNSFFRPVFDVHRTRWYLHRVFNLVVSHFYRMPKLCVTQNGNENFPRYEILFGACVLNALYEVNAALHSGCCHWLYSWYQRFQVIFEITEITEISLSVAFAILHDFRWIKK